MRRFELVEGTSSKFWQVARTGESLEVTFGRIGTAGQTQVKKLASEAAAQAEHDKLVREKVKKGYHEVGAGDGAAPVPAASAATVPAASAAPVPAATKKPATSAVASPSAAVPARVPPSPTPPAAAPTAPPVASSPSPVTSALPAGDLPPITWRAGLLAKLAPMRGATFGQLDPPDARAAYATIAKGMARASDVLEAGAAHAGANTALMRAARDAFTTATAPATRAADAQAAAFALIGPKADQEDVERYDAFIEYWWGTEGRAFALDALLAAFSLHTHATTSSVALVADESGPWWRSRGLTGWRTLRRLAVTAPDEEHATLMALAEAALPRLDARAKLLLAVAFERPAFCPTGELQRTGGYRSRDDWSWPLLVAVETMDDVRACAGALSASPWELAAGLAEHADDLLARHGTAAAGLLMQASESMLGGANDTARELAETVARVNTPEAVAFFVKHLDGRELRAIGSAYLLAHPTLALVPVAEAAANKAASADAARAVLKLLLPAVPPDALAKTIADPALAAPARQLLTELAVRATVAEEAPLAALPRVLASPPWRAKVTALPPLVVELQPLPFVETMPTPPEAHEIGGGHPENAEKAADALARIRHVQNDGKGYVYGVFLLPLSKDDLLGLLPVLDLERVTYWSHFGVAQTLMRRHGVAMLELALKVATVEPLEGLAALATTSSARVAPLMADAWTRLKSARALAASWLATFPEAAAVGLIPLGVGTPGKTRNAAERALRFVASRGHRAIIEDVAVRYGEPAQAAVARVLDFDPLLDFPKKLPSLPAFFQAAALARPLLKDGRALPLEAVEALTTMLAFSPPGEPYAGLADVKAACDAPSLAAFAWDLFQAWLASGAGSKEQWALGAVGLFGDDECARRLAALIRVWPGEAAHQRAVTGLDVLARIGTDVALMHLHGIAQKVKFKALQERAREKIDEIAEAREMTADELADRLVPSLGLDDDGSLTLDFGARTFRVVFDESLKPAVNDDAGTRLSDLPKPRQTDDAEKSKAAVDEWKALKKDGKTIASAQLARLEQAMCSQRRWPVEVFRRFLLEHPLLIHLVRRLLWGVYDGGGALGATFRVAEDRTFADARDEGFVLDDGTTVGIVHRLELDDAQVLAWSQVFGDYEILQPFPQLARDVHRPADGQGSAKALETVVGLDVPTGKVLGLDSRGWRRGPPQDAGVVCWYEKPLPNDVVAHLDLDGGIYTGAIAESPRQKLGKVTLEKGSGWTSSGSFAFDTLGAVAFSELVRDLESLRE